MNLFFHNPSAQQCYHNRVKKTNITMAHGRRVASAAFTSGFHRSRSHKSCAWRNMEPRLSTLVGWLGARTFHQGDARTFRSNEASITKSKPSFWELDSVVSSADTDRLKMCYSAASWFLSHTLPLLPGICPSTIRQYRAAYIELSTSFSLCLECVPGEHSIRLSSRRDVFKGFLI